MWETYRKYINYGNYVECISKENDEERTFVIASIDKESRGLRDYKYTITTSVEFLPFIESFDYSIYPIEKEGFAVRTNDKEAKKHYVKLLKKYMDEKEDTKMTAYIGAENLADFEEGKMVKLSFVETPEYNLELKISRENIFLPTHEARDVFAKKTNITIEEELETFYTI